MSKIRKNTWHKVYFRKAYCYFDFDRTKSEKFKNQIKIRQEVCTFIVNHLLNNITKPNSKKELTKMADIEISTNRLKFEYNEQKGKLTLAGFHHTLVYLHDLLTSFKLKKGRLIYHKSYNIEKQPSIKGRMPYQKTHYEALERYYQHKIVSIHIHHHFILQLVSKGWEKIAGFVKDYFSIDYKSFRTKHFDKQQQKLMQLPLTKSMQQKIIHNLNDEQKQIIEDKSSKAILVLAGPGSGKTKILVHKIASLITEEHKKPEYFLMLAHSRVAVREFKERLKKLIGYIAYDMRIYTFHALATELCGQFIGDGNKDTLNKIIEKATQWIEDGKIRLPPIQMLVLDEYQDVGQRAYAFIKAIYAKMMETKQIIAVGDDDQCINNFSEDKADTIFIKQFAQDFQGTASDGDDKELLAKKMHFRQYELLNNYRSCAKIVDFANAYRSKIPNRLKNNNLIAIKEDKGSLSLNGYAQGYLTHIIKMIKDQIQTNTNHQIAILLRNNDEVMTCYAQLRANDIKAQYIIERDGFTLGDLAELRAFLSFYEQNGFDKAKEQLHNCYQASTNYPSACEIIDYFANEYEEEYRDSDQFDSYLQHIDFDEFTTMKAKVVVSTMHKAKGKEFDSVHIGIKQDMNAPDEQRLLYVAITRAKTNLHLHISEQGLYTTLPINDFPIDRMLQSDNNHISKIYFVMKLCDIVLYNKREIHSNIQQTFPIAGDSVTVDRAGGVDRDSWSICKDNKPIATLSKKFKNKIAEKEKQGYQLEPKARILYVVDWLNRNDNKRHKQILCALTMIIRT